MYISGLQEGDWIALTGEFTNGDSDFMAWPGDLPEEDYSYYNNILGNQMSSLDIPETGGFYWDSASDVLVGCFDYSIEPGEWTLTVDAFYWHHSETASLVEPSIPGYSPFTGDPIDPTQFSFMYISGLQEGGGGLDNAYRRVH
ncbi:MAG: hypothetical protein ACXACD_09615 [Candidatus Thorarchaeota archaeon]|jgi:hypothetical protein